MVTICVIQIVVYVALLVMLCYSRDENPSASPEEQQYAYEPLKRIEAKRVDSNMMFKESNVADSPGTLADGEVDSIEQLNTLKSIQEDASSQQSKSPTKTPSLGKSLSQTTSASPTKPRLSPKSAQKTVSEPKVPALNFLGILKKSIGLLSPRAKSSPSPQKTATQIPSSSPDPPSPPKPQSLKAAKSNPNVSQQQNDP